MKLYVGVLIGIALRLTNLKSTEYTHNICFIGEIRKHTVWVLFYLGPSPIKGNLTYPFVLLDILIGYMHS